MDLDLLRAVAQVPPTPTLLPVSTPLFDMPSVGMWSSTDTLLQFWNHNPTVGYGIQIFVLVMLVVFGVSVILYFVKSLGSDRDDT